MNNIEEIIIDEFIANLTRSGQMNCGEIYDKCEDMGYEVQIDRIIKIMHSNPHRPDNSGCLMYPEWPLD